MLGLHPIELAGIYHALLRGQDPCIFIKIQSMAACYCQTYLVYNFEELVSQYLTGMFSIPTTSKRLPVEIIFRLFRHLHALSCRNSSGCFVKPAIGILLVFNCSRHKFNVLERFDLSTHSESKSRVSSEREW